ncbi:MAG: filamentous hemagglutinin, partial [Comamonadaceae bacterium]
LVLQPPVGRHHQPARTRADVARVAHAHAGKITLVGTEAGVGVRNAGHIGAGAGGLVVTADGRLENKGTLEAAKVELSSAADIDNRGGTIRQAGTRELAITAAVLSNTGGGFIGAEPVAQPETGTPPASNPGITNDAGTVTPTTGTGTTTGSATPASSEPAPLQPAPATGPGAIVAAGSLLNDGGRIYAGGEIALNTPRIDNTGGSLTVGTMAVTGERFSNAGGTLNVARSFNADVGRFDNTGGTLHAGDLLIRTAGDLVNRDGTLTSNSAVELAAGGTLDNTAGTIVGNDAAHVTAGVVTNQGGKIHAAGTANLTISAAALLDNRNQGEIGAGGNNTISAGTLDNDAGRITAVGDLRVTALGA